MRRFHHVRRDELSLQRLERQLGEYGQDRSGDSALQDQAGVVEGETGDDGFAEPAGADESRERHRAYADYRGGVAPNLLWTPLNSTQCISAGLVVSVAL